MDPLIQYATAEDGVRIAQLFGLISATLASQVQSGALGGDLPMPLDFLISTTRQAERSFSCVP